MSDRIVRPGKRGVIRRLQRTIIDLLLGLPRALKRAAALVVDIVLCFLSVHLAFMLRLDAWQPVAGPAFYVVFVGVCIQIPVFITQGLYRTIFRYSENAAMRAIARACILFAIPFAAIFTFVSISGVPRTVGILVPTLLFLLVALSRVLAHWMLSPTYRLRIREASLPRVVIYGAGGAGRQLASAIGQAAEMRLVGFADDDPGLHGATVNGLQVYSPQDLDRLIVHDAVDELLLAIPTISRRRRKEIVEHASSQGLKVRMLPAMIDIASGRISTADLKNVAIEDILTRAAVPPDETLLKATIAGCTVLVTGAGGSIGSELCRQILTLGHKRLLLVDHSEYNLYAIHNELHAMLGRWGEKVEIVPLLGSVRDLRRMEELVGQYRPQTIFHAAAYKHVPLVEDNPCEGIENNVMGTLAMVKVARRFDVANFILISSDKAVRPTNVMGASKRLAELVVQAFAELTPHARYSMVRFGNVLGSSGSVVPLFREQIAGGGPVTITDREMTRYFMTIPEAAQLVIQAGAMARGGDVFLLDMGDPVRIIDLASNMIRLSGLSVRDVENPQGDIEIVEVGIRPGEKLYEELLIGGDPEASSHPRIWRAREAHMSWNELQPVIESMQSAVGKGETAEVMKLLCQLVPEYRQSVSTECGHVRVA